MTELVAHLSRAGVADVRDSGGGIAAGRLALRPALLARCTAVREGGRLRAQLHLLPAEPVPEGWAATEAFLQAVQGQVRGIEFAAWAAREDDAICLQVGGDAADASQLLDLLTSLGRVVLEGASALCCDAELARAYIDVRGDRAVEAATARPGWPKGGEPG
ncbi:MAG: hypothetical protein U9R79_03215 [Armatimonadota bacterium]|nr:hypothetical protein [Armatimonadota bacterium]